MEADKVVEKLSCELARQLDKKKLRLACQNADRGDRIYGYTFVVNDVCKRVFKYYMGRVYYFDGRIWAECNDAVLKQSLRVALAEKSLDAVNCRTIQRDWSKIQTLVFNEAYNGAKLNELKLNKALVGFRNGVWDFTDVDNPVYHPFSDKMEVLSLLPYDYDPRALCPTWESFLCSVLTRGQRELLQKFLGLGIVDRKAMARKVESTLWLVGPGANGKSVIFDVVLGVYGRESVSSVGLKSLISGNGGERARFIGEVVGKTFNYCTEIQADVIGGSADAFKSLCSGEPQIVKRLYKDVDTAYDIPYLIFNMNQKPVFKSLDEAVMRRLLFIKFKTTVRDVDRNPNLSSELASEYSGIRNWMIAGYRKFVADGYKLTATAESASEERETLIENGKSVHVFVRDMGYRSTLSAGNWKEKPKVLLASQFYSRYVEYCEKSSLEAVTMKQFGGDLKVLGFEKRRVNVGMVYDVYSDEDIEWKIQ